MSGDSAAWCLAMQATTTRELLPAPQGDQAEPCSSLKRIYFLYAQVLSALANPIDRRKFRIEQTHQPTSTNKNPRQRSPMTFWRD